MAEYKRLLIKQNYSGSQVIDTLEQFNVACQEFPYKNLPEIKDLPKRDWPDENGEDVYIPSSGLRFKAYDIDVKMLYVGTESNMSTQIKSFIDFF